MKPALIILHGALGCKEQFTEWKNALADNFDCYLLDFSGHGSRSEEEGSFSINKFSEELTGYIKKHNLSQPNILGYSMGGYVALYTALKHPELAGKIMTVATKFDWTIESSKREAGYLQPQLMEGKAPQLVEQLKQRHGAHWENVVNKTAEMMLMLGEKPFLTREDCKEIKNKIKFCVGDKDKMVSVAETFSMYNNATDTCFCVLPNTGHLPETMPVERIKFELLDFLLV